MTQVRITEDTPLRELFGVFPEAKEVLKDYGYGKILELDIEDVIVDKLSLGGFCRLMGLGEEGTFKVIGLIQSLYNKRLEE